MSISSMKLTVVFLLWMITGSNEIQNVKMIVPPIVRAGSSATLLCLYDLEGASLYSVQWYRGKFEFFRFVPKDNPPTKVFEILGLYVDTFSSSEHQVTLRNIPLQISGEFTCEITTDAPRFSTSSVSENLTVIDFNLDLQVPKDQYHFGEVIEANCSLMPKLPSTKILFYWNGKLVSDEHVTDQFSESVSLKLNSSTFDIEETLPMSIELKCSAVLDKMYYVESKSVFIKLKTSDYARSNTVRPRFIFYLYLYFVLVWVT